MSHPIAVVATPQDEAYNLIEREDVTPNHCLFRNYNRLEKQYGHLAKRTYEVPLRWYFLTFKPFDKNYERDIEEYLYKGFDHCRKKIGKVEILIMTREIEAKKVHINVLCASDRRLDTLLHQKHTNRYFIYCQECVSAWDTFKYIFKESNARYFHKYLDYVVRK